MVGGLPVTRRRARAARIAYNRERRLWRRPSFQRFVQWVRDRYAALREAAGRDPAIAIAQTPFRSPSATQETRE